MSQAFLGEIKLFAGNFAPFGYAFCAGQVLPISQNDALFQLLGTTFGGDGVNTFNLPDLRGRIPIHAGTGFVLGQTAGSETVTLSTSQLPSHIHAAQAVSANGNQLVPAGNVWAASTLNQYASPPANGQMNAGTIGNAGGSQPHDNMMPYLALNFIIALQGIFPSRN